MKKQELSWKAGGQQGEGLESLGEIFAAALCSLGYDVYGYRQFSSRIKGGHTSYKLRIANHPVATIASSCNLLIAMDPDTLEVDAPELTAEGILVTDAAWLEGKKPKVRTVALSWNELSKADGKTLPKNILALGITAALLGIATAKLLPLLEKQYGRKGAEVMETNRLALETGYEYIKNNYHDLLAAFTMPELENPQPKLFMLGNEAVALGGFGLGRQIHVGLSDNSLFRNYGIYGKIRTCRRRRDAADGRRDLGLHDGDRRSLCRRPRFHCDSRPRLIADGGSNRPGGNDRDPAGRDRYTERRPQYRPADQA